MSRGVYGQTHVELTALSFQQKTTFRNLPAVKGQRGQGHSNHTLGSWGAVCQLDVFSFYF